MEECEFFVGCVFVVEILGLIVVFFYVGDIVNYDVEFGYGKGIDDEVEGD